MKFIKHLFFMMAIAAIALAVVTSWPTKPVSNAEAAVSHLQQEDPLKPDMDTYVASGSEWANNPRGESPGLFVGYGDSEAFDLEQTRTFIQFNVTLPKNQVLTGPATLRLYLTFATFESLGESMTIEIHKVTQSWDNDATWDDKLQYDPTVITSQPVNTDVNHWFEWQIPQDVIQDWIDNPKQNYGIALVSPDGETRGRHIRNFHSNEFENDSFAPQLRVSYTDPTPVPPTNTPIPTNTPTPTHTPTPTPTPIPPRLSLEVNNVPNDEVTAGDPIFYNISYRNASQTNITLKNVVITGSIPISTTLDRISDPKAVTSTNKIVFKHDGDLEPGQGGELIYSVIVNTTGTTKMAVSTIPMMNVITTPTDSMKQVMDANRSTRTSLRSNLAIVPATEPRMMSEPIPIVNCVTGSSDQTKTTPVEICIYNGGTRLYLPLMFRASE